MLKEIISEKVWNDIVIKNLPTSGGFLESWQWGEFQKQAGCNIFRVANENGYYAQAIEHKLPFGKYWYLPRNYSNSEFEKEAAKRGVTFLRFEPEATGQLPPAAIKTIPVSPPATLIVDLGKTEDELKVDMHEKTRYNIRLAERKGVKVSKSQSEKDFKDFWNLIQETAKRDGFRTHSKFYYQKMLKILQATSYKLQANTCAAELWLAKWEEKILAAGIWIYFNDTVTYLHGASSSQNRNVMAPYALHWQIMKDTKARGFKFYDFWGIETTSYQLPATSSSWAGITRFKTGFGGKPLEFPGTYDLPLLKFRYSIYKLVRLLRRITRP